jgi:uncharacterized protein (TIGR02001 family)
MRGRGAGPPRLIWIAFLALLAVASAAQAQVSASFGVASDYRVRGISVSGARPVASFNLDYDHSSGFYFGGSAIAEQTAGGGVKTLGHVEYLGLATHSDAGLSWDLGVKNQSTTLYGARQHELQYADIYAGVFRDDVSLHVHYYPDHMSGSGSLVYVDLNGVARRGEDWRLTGHLGVTTPIDGPGGRTGGRERYDLRLGVAREFRHCELTLGWTLAFPRLRPQFPQDSSALVAGATLFF